MVPVVNIWDNIIIRIGNYSNDPIRRKLNCKGFKWTKLPTSKFTFQVPKIFKPFYFRNVGGGDKKLAK